MKNIIQLEGKYEKVTEAVNKQSGEGDIVGPRVMAGVAGPEF